MLEGYHDVVLTDKVASVQLGKFPEAVFGRLAQIPVRAATLARLMVRTDAWRNVTPASIAEALRVLVHRNMNPTLMFRIHAKSMPRHAAVIFRGQARSYADLDGQMDTLAGWLVGKGVRKGVRVLLFMRNRPEYIALSGAITRAGAAAVNAPWRSTAAELGYLIGNSDSRVIFFESNLEPAVAEALRGRDGATLAISVGDEIRNYVSYESIASRGARGFTIEAGSDEDAAVVIYTSGTTGKPKGAVRRFPREAIFAAMRFMLETPMRASDVHLVTCPLYHSTAFAFTSLTQLLGGTVVVLDEFKPEGFLQAIERHRVTTTAVVPTMLSRVMALGKETLARYDTSSLRAIFTVGAALPGPLGTEVMNHFGDILYNLYGATEFGLVTFAKPSDLRAAPTTIGRLIPGNVIRLVDDDRRDVKPGTIGELFAKNDTIVSGYHNDDAATRASMLDGFFSVGDLARVDERGLYFLEGRKREMIISGGVNVYPAEVESVLEAHPSVTEAAVVGVEDSDWGERVRAFVVLRDGAQIDEGQLLVWTRERLSGAKVPRQITFLEALPRNPTGKVLKRDLKSYNL